MPPDASAFGFNILSLSKSSADHARKVKDLTDTLPAATLSECSIKVRLHKITFAEVLFTG